VKERPVGGGGKAPAPRSPRRSALGSDFEGSGGEARTGEKGVVLQVVDKKGVGGENIFSTLVNGFWGAKRLSESSF